MLQYLSMKKEFLGSIFPGHHYGPGYSDVRRRGPEEADGPLSKHHLSVDSSTGLLEG